MLAVLAVCSLGACRRMHLPKRVAPKRGEKPATPSPLQLRTPKRIECFAPEEHAERQVARGESR